MICYEDVWRLESKPFLVLIHWLAFLAKIIAFYIIVISHDLWWPELSVLPYIHNKGQENFFKIF